jgi:hypothetical protein
MNYTGDTMTNDERVNTIIASLDRHFTTNMGQKSVYLKNTIAVLQRRDDNNYLVYFFDNKDSILELDIKESTGFRKFTRDNLISFLNEELVEW